MTYDNVVNEIKHFLQDDADLNRLLERQEIDDLRIREAIDRVIEDYNLETPFTSYTITDFPGKKYLVFDSAVEVLIMAGIFYSRNSLIYSAAGTSVSDMEDKDARYQNWIRIIMAEVIRMRKLLKKRDLMLKIARMDGLHSNMYYPMHAGNINADDSE